MPTFTFSREVTREQSGTEFFEVESATLEQAEKLLEEDPFLYHVEDDDDFEALEDTDTGDFVFESGEGEYE